MKLNSIKIIILLQISTGYRTISTGALTTITSIPPKAMVLKYEYTKGNIFHLKQEQMSSTHFPNITIQQKKYIWQIHPAEETSYFQVNTTLGNCIPAGSLTIFTDGSLSATDVAAAYCVTEGGVLTHQWACILNDNTSVFQAEIQITKSRSTEIVCLLYRLYKHLGHLNFLFCRSNPNSKNYYITLH